MTSPISGRAAGDLPPETDQSPNPKDAIVTSAGTAAERHVPVLRDRIVELLGPALAQGDSAGPAVFLDATLGHGGHTAAILAAYPSVRAIGLDRDASALASARERLGVYADRVTFVQAVYDELAEVLRSLELATVSAILFDLGVSSMQLDDPERGFAYRYDAPLDMRMDQGDGVTAAEILNTYAAGDLERVLREYGEERFARRIARAIVTERAASPFDHSARLVEVIRSAIPVAAQHGGGHPAKRTFQALRIEVNDELAVWRRAVSVAIDVLDVGGRIAVLSYHSLEDRIAKQAFAAGSQSRTPHGLPVELPDAQPYLRLVTRGAERPSAVEESANPRAASARLRVAERIRRGSPVGGDLTGGTAYQPYRSHRTTSKGPRR